MKVHEPVAQTPARRLRIPDGAGPVAGVELEYRVKGAGEPVVFLHGGILTDWFGPLADELSKTGSYRLVSYHRPGYGSSTLPSQPITMAGQAECCLALMRNLGLVKAHLVGHSIGACIALQAALQEPEAVASVGLLEPPVMTATPDPSPALTVLRASAALWKQGDVAGAMDTFMREIVDPDYVRVLDRALGTWREDALKGTDAFFQTDQPAVQAWRFGHLRRLACGSPQFFSWAKTARASIRSASPFTGCCSPGFPMLRDARWKGPRTCCLYKSRPRFRRR